MTIACNLTVTKTQTNETMLVLTMETKGGKAQIFCLAIGRLGFKKRAQNLQK